MTLPDSVFESLSPRELAGAVTPLFILDSRNQHAALDELVARCERLESALKDAKSVCETLPGKLHMENIPDALTEIEWLTARLRDV